MSDQPMHSLVAQLRRSGFTVTSATKEFASREPLMRITTPDGRYSMIVKESDYFADPDRCTDNIRFSLRKRGYPV